MNRKWKGGSRWLLLVFAFFLTASVFGMTKTAYAARQGKWVRNDGCIYYLKPDGNRAEGIVKIGKKHFYFDSNGVQRTGWRNIGGSYYFFRVAHKTLGYMQKNKTIDGIRTGADGKAVVTGSNKRKLIAMTKASEILDLITKPTWSYARKRKAAFSHVCWSYGNVILPDYFYYEQDWDALYAYILFYQGYGDCFSYATGFAYLMNAIGYHKVYIVHNTRHCFVEWNNHTFDPHWHMTYPYTDTYYISPAQNGTGGRPDLILISQYYRNIEE